MTCDSLFNTKCYFSGKIPCCHGDMNCVSINDGFEITSFIYSKITNRIYINEQYE